MNDLPSDRELDTLVAEKVYHCRVVRLPAAPRSPVTEYCCGCYGYRHSDEPDKPEPRVKSYSARLDHSWELLRLLCETYRLQFIIRGSREYCRVALGRRQESGACAFEDGVEGEGENFMHAVCRAAVKATEIFSIPPVQPSSP